MRKIEVEEKESMRFDKWVAMKCEDLSRTRLQKLIEEEKVLVNGKPRESIVKSKEWRYCGNRRGRGKKDQVTATRHTSRDYL